MTLGSRSPLTIRADSEESEPRAPSTPTLQRWGTARPEEQNPISTTIRLERQQCASKARVHRHKTPRPTIAMPATPEKRKRTFDSSDLKLDYLLAKYESYTVILGLYRNVRVFGGLV